MTDRSRSQDRTLLHCRPKVMVDAGVPILLAADFLNRLREP